MNNTFEEYLRNVFAEQYEGLDDEMPDAEAEWFSDLDPLDVIEWADRWAEKEYARGVVDGQRKVSKAMDTVLGREDR